MRRLRLWNSLAIRSVVLACCWWSLSANVVLAQPAPPDPAAAKSPAPKSEELPAPAKVDVQPVADDEDIRNRLQSVLEATGWFRDPVVRVDKGVVFLNGTTDSDELKKWASDLARNTQDVVAVANRMEVAPPSLSDFSVAWGGMAELWQESLRALPLVVFGLFVICLFGGAGWLATSVVLAMVGSHIRARLLRNVLARGAGFAVFLAGIYIVLRISGLTQLALTLVGGTGLIGLAVGLAFRDITENFLASILLSIQRPFETGDLVEVATITGYVQQLNVRTTVLMTLDGNLVQIPNALVYKGTLRNFTANPNRRETFVVGIGYDDPIDTAQEIARRVLAEHPGVLQDPEPWVLTDGLGQATVNLRLYFWLNGKEHSWLKVRSSVMRLVKRAFQEEGISMPDGAREVIFPKGVPVTMLEPREKPAVEARLPGSVPLPPPTMPTKQNPESASTEAEGGLKSDAAVLNEQARQASPLPEENLLRASGQKSS